ncbi:MAG: hypothetical protein SWY16_23435 [Cyanobacteriota bacterium]|nr:hypothetical protein [Cyanobacteriota bacterium]
MDNNVSQWIGEIQSLQQQLARVKQELAAARASAEHWRSLYTTEAQQRRDFAEADRAKIEQLETQLQQSQTAPKRLQTDVLNVAQQEAEQLPFDQLKPKLVDRTVECDRLRQELAQLRDALKTERDNHAKTRTDLTTALGDTVSLISSAKANNSSPDIPQFLEPVRDTNSQETEEPGQVSLPPADEPKQLNPNTDLPLPQLPASGDRGTF